MKSMLLAMSMLMLTLMGLTGCASQGLHTLAADDSPLRDGDRIVFLGDSITAGGVKPGGYVTLIGEAVAKSGRNVELIGAGISGNKVPNLQTRLQKDVLDKQPTIVWIYIGINDVWHSERNQGTPTDAYEAGLREIIGKVQQAGAAVVLATPTVIGEKRNGGNNLDEMLNEYSAISRRVAREMGVTLCDLRRAFVEHLKANNPDDAEKGILTRDRVHLNDAGNRFVAEHAAACIARAARQRN